MSRRRLLAVGIGAGVCAGIATAEEPQVSAEDKRLRNDWPYLNRYRAENAALLSSGASVDAVFMGDSITEGWLSMTPAFFVPGRVCRGISGQTTPQMLVRFRQDVIQLHPRIVHIMAGTNDIAGNTGPSTAQMTQDNIQSMAEIAQANKVRIMLASITPAWRFPWRPGLETATAISELNKWTCAYAHEIGAVFADYHGVMSDDDGGMRPRTFKRRCPPERGGLCGDETRSRSRARCRERCLKLSPGNHIHSKLTLPVDPGRVESARAQVRAWFAWFACAPVVRAGCQGD